MSFTNHLAGGLENLEDLEGSTETKVSAGVGLLGMDGYGSFWLTFQRLLRHPGNWEMLDIAGPWMTMDYMCY